MNDQEERAAMEAMRTSAKMTREFYKELVDQGFNPIEALQLTGIWLRASWTKPPESR